MRDMDDMSLLREYVDRQSEAAFAALVERHIGVVYCAALRQVRDPGHAEEVTQVVFILLARKADRLRPNTILSAWLYQTVRHAAADFRKKEFRRQQREQEACHMQSTSTDDSAWDQITPLLDEAMAALGEKDRNALILRFFEGKSLAEVGAALSIDSVTAQKRVWRAVDKMRRYFAQHGAVLSTATILTALSTRAVHAVPAGLAVTVAAAAAGKGAAVTTSTTTALKTTLKLMAWTKAKTAVIVAIGFVVAAGTATIAVKEIKAGTAGEPWQVQNISADTVNRLRPEVAIVPTKFPGAADSTLRRPGPGIEKFVGINVPASVIAAVAYGDQNPAGLPWSADKIRFTAPDSGAMYDFIATLPQGATEALKAELKSKLGLVAHLESTDTNVLVLKVARANAPGLKPSGGAKPDFGVNFDGARNRFYCRNQSMAFVADTLAHIVNQPVVDQTGLTRQVDFDVSWAERGAQDPTHQAFQQAMLNEIGLSLSMSQETVEMLVVEKVN